MKTSSNVKDFTRGGQITLHNFRMYLQIVDKVFLACIVVFFATSIGLFYSITSSYQRYIWEEFIGSKLSESLNPAAKEEFILPNGSKTTVRYASIAGAPLVISIMNDVDKEIAIAIMSGTVLSVISFIFIAKWLIVKGKKHTDDISLRGDNFVTSDQLKTALIKEKSDSDLILAGLPLVKDKETAHFIFHGTTGTGKSNAIKELLDQIRTRGDRVVVYDKSCNYLEEFYRAGEDILLNPLDERGQPWDLWLECRDAADFDSLAAAQIPMPVSNQDPFWVNAARTIFSAAAYEMRKDKDRSLAKLLQALLTADLGTIQKYLKGTEAETLASDKIEKTAVSIKSVLATYLKSLKYVNDQGNAFSIRKWINDEKASNWLFITSLGDRHETLKPLISCWLDIAVNGLLSLSSNTQRRIWLILDELTSLQPLPYLTQTLSESRKFGGCIIIGIQNYAQLCKLYSNDGAREISALLNTRIMFRQPDPEMAKWAAINFGENIKDEVREGISYGANTMRDGVSINRVETQKQLVSYSEIMCLADLEAFVRLPGQYPLTRIKFSYQPREKKNTAFVLRDYESKLSSRISTEDLSDKEIMPSRLRKTNLKKIHKTDHNLSPKSEQALDI